MARGFLFVAIFIVVGLCANDKAAAYDVGGVCEIYQAKEGGPSGPYDYEKVKKVKTKAVQLTKSEPCASDLVNYLVKFVRSKVSLFHGLVSDKKVGTQSCTRLWHKSGKAFLAIIEIKGMETPFRHFGPPKSLSIVRVVNGRKRANLLKHFLTTDTDQDQVSAKVSHLCDIDNNGIVDIVIEHGESESSYTAIYNFDKSFDNFKSRKLKGTAR